MPLFGKKNKSVKYTEQSFARLEQTDGEGNNALHLACEVNDWEKMMTILAESYKQPAKLKALLLQKNADGQTPPKLGGPQRSQSMYQPGPVRMGNEPPEGVQAPEARSAEASPIGKRMAPAAAPP